MRWRQVIAHPPPLPTTDACLGIVANPVSARDIRRVVANAGNLQIADRVDIVIRLLQADRAAGVGRALLMPDRGGIRALLEPAGDATLADMHAIYAALCDALAAAFARLGVLATAQPVQGSFCDGRWNLAVNGRKVVGTAQAWQRVGGRQVVLAHALIIVGADPAALTAGANAIEAEVGRGMPHRTDALTSLAREAPTLPDLEACTLEVLAEQSARVVPPRVVKETEYGPARVLDDGPA